MEVINNNVPVSATAASDKESEESKDDPEQEFAELNRELFSLIKTAKELDEKYSVFELDCESGIEDQADLHLKNSLAKQVYQLAGDLFYVADEA